LITGPTIGFKLGGSGDATASNRLQLENQTQRIGSGVAVDGRLDMSTLDRGRSMYRMRDGKVL
jgi:hypothetical protein